MYVTESEKGQGHGLEASTFKKCCFCWLYLSHVTQSKLMIDPPLSLSQREDDNS